MTPPHNYLAVIKVNRHRHDGVDAVNRMIEQDLKVSSSSRSTPTPRRC